MVIHYGAMVTDLVSLGDNGFACTPVISFSGLMSQLLDIKIVLLFRIFFKF